MGSKYEESILSWRREKESSLRAQEGWLSLAGLFWLAEGVNSVGSSAESSIRLPERSAPRDVGEFVRQGDEVVFRAAPGAGATRAGEAVDRVVMSGETQGPAMKILVGNVTMALIRRGERLGIRVWDRSSPRRESFPVRAWFPIDPRYRVTAEYEPYAEPRPILAPDVSGGVQTMHSPGEVAFSLMGRRLRLMASEQDEGSLFLIFTDQTSGSTTYPAGRYLYTPPPEGRTVEIDFNHAYSPPCAFTPYATCPLPPKDNHIPLAIEAGERYVAEGEGLT